MASACRNFIYLYDKFKISITCNDLYTHIKVAIIFKKEIISITISYIVLLVSKIKAIYSVFFEEVCMCAS